MEEAWKMEEVHQVEVVHKAAEETRRVVGKARRVGKEAHYKEAEKGAKKQVNTYYLLIVVH